MVSHSHSSSPPVSLLVRAIVQITWPLFVLPYLLLKYLYKGVIGWWLDPWLTEQDRKRLLGSITDDMPLLSSKGKLVKIERSSQSFNDATVCLDIENVRVSIARWRGEISVRLAPHASLEDWYELGVVLEAFGYTHGASESSHGGLREVDRLLGLYSESIRTEFSVNRYLEFKGVLSKINSDRRTVAGEIQWQLEKHLARVRR